MPRLHELIVLLFLFIIVLAACQPSSVNQTVVTAAVPTAAPTLADPGMVIPRATPDLAELPLLAAHLQRVQEALQQPVPVLTLDASILDDAQQQAQAIALGDSRIQTYLRDTETQSPLRNEIFGVYPMRASDITPQTAACSINPCYRVEMYNYPANFYLAAAVDLQTETVLEVSGFENTQPDIPTDLTNIALEIAVNSPEVIQALGYSPEAQDAVMANTRTALNGTFCERSRHLCVAPTFVSGERALWAIVDLTDGRVVGVRWTEVGSTGEAVSEKQLVNDSIMRLYCQQETALERDGWSLNYTLTSSDGLRISKVHFQDIPILESAKLVDWHVSYSSADGFGYSDAVGCPVFSQAAVIAVEPPYVEDIEENGQVVGFALEQEFWSEFWPLPCNYYYEQRYEFYQDGRFRPVMISVGRGCGDDGTYRPVTRLALAGNYTFGEWSGSEWADWPAEDWRLAADVSSNEQGYPFRLSDAEGQGFYVVPSNGQFGDGGRGDNAYIYVTRRHTDRDEGDSDMPTIGPCCNADYQQGPEKFIDTEPETIAGSPLVLWYVAQLENDGSPGNEYCWAESVLENGLFVPIEYPCPSGPMFVPLERPT
jgi:hypothetical protein